jgi:hypothetical protein
VKSVLIGRSLRGAVDFLPHRVLRCPFSFATERRSAMPASDLSNGPRVVPQPVAAPLTRAAIFLVVTLKPGRDSCATVRSFCGDLSGLVRAVEFRDVEGSVSCVMAFGGDAWDRLFGENDPPFAGGSYVIRSICGRPRSRAARRNWQRQAPASRGVLRGPDRDTSGYTGGVRSRSSVKTA